jgi:hypothetical protein
LSDVRVVAETERLSVQEVVPGWSLLVADLFAP